jgi:hypothetical protein
MPLTLTLASILHSMQFITLGFQYKHCAVQINMYTISENTNQLVMPTLAEQFGCTRTLKIMMPK